MTFAFRPNAFRLSLAALSVAALAGCASNVKLDEPAVPVESRTATPAAQAPAASQSQVATVTLDKRDLAGATGIDRTVYFDFDSFVVRGDARPVVELHAGRLARNKDLRLSVEGHTDDRGGREYNLALGQKRAEAVVKSLVVLGAKESQLEAVSFGLERPAAEGRNEAAWAKNRRAELRDR
jgi:peptidoglycan-associated lipoprotein